MDMDGYGYYPKHFDTWIEEDGTLYNITDTIFFNSNIVVAE